HDRFDRGDIIVGITHCPALLNEYLEAEGALADPLADTGADYVYVAFDVRFLPDGRQSEARGEIEEALDQALRSTRSGRLVGGAHGLTWAYVDLLLYDGGTSIEVVKEMLKQRGLPSGTRLEYFAKEKRNQRIKL